MTVSKNAPLARPVASDTVLGLSDILGKRTVIGQRARQRLLRRRPGQQPQAVASFPGTATTPQVTADKRIRVTITAKSQIIPFKVAHPDDETIASYAFVRVPGYDDALPQLKRGAPKLQRPE